ncbi:MAG: trypsin-like peptidase domain-containing protein [Gemmataceae bacterium]
MRQPQIGRNARRWGAWALGVGLAALSPCVQHARATLPVAAGNARRTPLVEVVDKVADAVVNIHSERSVTPVAGENLFSPDSGANRVNGMGTGIVLDPRGFIVTNQHVVDDVQVIRVKLRDGSTYPAKVIARDPESDLALLKVEPRRPLATIPLGTAGDLMIGETVFAVGNAYGYEHTVTTGIVSAIKRDVTLNKEMAYKSLIQTDTSINPGNSGGPLINVHGELVGVNVAIRAGAQGIAFAIPVDSMIRVSAEMISVRRRSGLTHGLTLADRVEPKSSPAVRYLTVEKVDAAATSAGFKVGDTVVRVGDTKVQTTLDFERALVDRPTGDKIPVIVRADGTERSVELVLRPSNAGAVVQNSDLIWRKLGLRLQSVASDTVTRVNAQLHGGLAILDVSPDGVAARAGIQRGDVLIGLHNWETLTVENVNYVLQHPELASLNPMRFFIIRSGQVRRGWLPQID